MTSTKEYIDFNSTSDRPVEMNPPGTSGRKPVCMIVLGMAGSGKTSLVTRLFNTEPKPYVVNLDPACINLPYFANIGEKYYVSIIPPKGDTD